VKSNVTWTKEKLNRAFKDMKNFTLGSRLQKVLDWALSNGSFLESRTILPSIWLFGKSNNRLASFIRDGEIFIYFNEHYRRGAEERDELASDLKRVDLLDKDMDVSKVVQGRNLSKRIQDLSEDDFNLLLQIFSKYCI
jgi:hypothetical protein